MKPLAAVTGGTGFLGGHILNALSGSGWRLRLLARRAPHLSLGKDPIEVVQGSLDDRDVLEAFVDGTDAVIHVAGAIKAATAQQFHAVNSDGTALLAKATRSRAPGKPFVFASTLAARMPDLSAYAASKADAERRLLDEIPDATILRPTAIYGPGDRETLALFRATSLPVQPMLNDANARVTLVHGMDVASAVAAAATHAQPGIFEITDAHHSGYSWPEIIAAAGTATGRSTHPILVPIWATTALGRLGDCCSQLTRKPAMLTTEKLNEIRHPDWSSVPADQFPSDDWQPSYDISTGFRDAVSWYRRMGWLRQ